MRSGLLVALAFAACPLMAADIPDLAGTWLLDVQKSTWGSTKKPVSVIVDVIHNQLSLSYSGTVTYENGESRDFSFTGNIDGTQFPATLSCGPGKMSFRRASLDTVTAKFRSDDGQYTEDVRMVLSRNGSRMTRYIQVKGPEGQKSWVEIYERK